MTIKMSATEWVYTIIAEIAFFGFLYYAQYLLKVEGDLLVSSFILWLLINVAVVLCPATRKCCLR